jgi:hypothetical protein
MLVIEYVLEGHQRGYNFTSSTQGYNDDDLKTIWRSAMPRGQGWSAFVGARSLKCFPLDEHQLRVAVCETTVTDLRDEHERGGIRRATIDVMARAEYLTYLEWRLRSLPGHIRAQVDKLPTLAQRLAIANKAMPKPRRNPQLVFVHDYDGPDRWQIVEGLLLKLALSPVGPMRRWGKIIPFTTLALSHADESALVALPTGKAKTIDRKTPTISF